ncbi:MAG: glycosyltransferase family 39 protein [Arcicella sp.]|nr:glycosyltransferase family 39 protein [Arcicella sp.]
MISTRTAYFSLFIIVTIAFVLRTVNLDKHGIFLDERATLLISQGMALEGNSQANCFYTPNKTTFTPREFWAPKTIDDFYDSIRRSDIGNSPFYYLLLHIWIKLFGMSDFSIRFISVLFSCATIVLLFVFINEHFKNFKLAILGAFLMAIEPFFIAMSQQTRNYSMTFFLTLLTTHIFLKIIKSEEENRRDSKLYWFYGILSALCLLSHFLTVTIFLAHGLYVLLFVRKMRPWYLLPISLSVGALAFGYWILFAGGNYTFQSLSHQAKVYYEEAHRIPNPHEGYIDPVTVKNVTKKSIPFFTDLFIFSNGLTSVLIGKKNLIIAFMALIVSLIGIYQFKKSNKIFWVGLIVGINIATFSIYSTAKFQYLELVNSGILVYIFIDYWKENKEVMFRNQLWLLAILAFLPTVFLIVMTIKNGHTYALAQQRYSGFSFPYSIIFSGIALLHASKFKPLNYFVWAVFAVQLYFISVIVREVLNDVSLKYNYRAKERVENPYPKIAQKLVESYAKGDTIVYPSYLKTTFASDIYTQDMKKSFLDAQYVNLYMPHDADYIQTVDAREPNKIFLKKSNGNKVEIFDFKGDLFRN